MDASHCCTHLPDPPTHRLPGAWLHVDAAFGLLARALPQTEEYASLNAGVAGLELADSIAGDAHKLLNVVSNKTSVLYAMTDTSSRTIAACSYQDI